MKLVFIPLIIILLSVCVACGSKKLVIDTTTDWVSSAKMEDSEVFVQTSSIRREGEMIFATEKKVFNTPDSKAEYVEKIREKYESLGKPTKADKWNDFAYTIYNCEYDCLNSRFRILSIEDFDSKGIRIERTTPNKNKIKWLNVDKETVGDYTFFFVCDSEN